MKKGEVRNFRDIGAFRGATALCDVDGNGGIEIITVEGSLSLELDLDTIKLIRGVLSQVEEFLLRTRPGRA